VGIQGTHRFFSGWIAAVAAIPETASDVNNLSSSDDASGNTSEVSACSEEYDSPGEAPNHAYSEGYNVAGSANKTHDSACSEERDLSCSNGKTHNPACSEERDLSCSSSKTHNPACSEECDLSCSSSKACDCACPEAPCFTGEKHNVVNRIGKACDPTNIGT
jgi:hypothetical protein